MEKFIEWAEDFENNKRESMRDPIGEIFYGCCMNESKEIPNEVKSMFLFNVIKKRAECLQMPHSDWACLFLAALAESPGTAVMYIYYMKYKKTDLTIDGIVSLFPFGFIPKEDLQILWDKQKTQERHNMLDSADVNQWLLENNC